MKDSNIRDSYEFYIKRVTASIDNINADLALIMNERMGLTKVLRAIADKCSLDWWFYNKYLSRDEQVRPSLEEIKKVYDTTAIIKFADISFNFDYKAVSMDLIKSYLKGIMVLYLKEYDLETKLNEAESKKIPYYLYYYIIEQYYESVAISLLRGKYYHVKNIGMIKVVIKRTSFDRKKVNWGASLALLKEFASKEHPEIYREFMNRDISKSEFIDALSPYFYDEGNNPTGFKWLVHITNDFSPWLSYSKANCNIDKKYLFGIVPTNYCNTKERSQSAFVKACRKEEDILYCDKLGFRDKLNALITFNPSYKDNFKLLEGCPT